MRTRVSYGVAVIALVICFVCPVVEMFDHWDHTLQTGNDTEYTLVLLALCVGMVSASHRIGCFRESTAAQPSYLEPSQILLA